MKRRTLSEAEAIARARIASIRADEASAASAHARALATSARARLNHGLAARDPLAREAAAIRAGLATREPAKPPTGNTARVVMPVLDDLLAGVTEYARDIEWSRP